MCDELGFERYAAHGGDLGAGVSSRMGEAHPEAVVGIHLLAVADPVHFDANGVTAERDDLSGEVVVRPTAQGNAATAPRIEACAGSA